MMACLPVKASMFKISEKTMFSQPKEYLISINIHRDKQLWLNLNVTKVISTAPFYSLRDLS